MLAARVKPRLRVKTKRLSSLVQQLARGTHCTILCSAPIHDRAKPCKKLERSDLLLHRKSHITESKTRCELKIKFGMNPSL